MARRKAGKIFKTDRRIRLGIWGLGRGSSFWSVCDALNYDVVAGCDYNQPMRERFQDTFPHALATADADEFLNGDFDAVVVATFCPNHAADAIACLRAGKHVLSEVTAFHTMAEGVRLAEEVEKSGLVYNLAENYPFTKHNMYLADKWHQGLFGELQYAEFEYVHNCHNFCYEYIDGTPIRPGYAVHNWRSWINFHYYNTHSLGPMMHITDTRPTRVSAMPATVRLPGYVAAAKGDGGGLICPSLITMSNGAVVRNLMGASTNDTHQQRIWGTRGSAESGPDLQIRFGVSGQGTKLTVNPQWPLSVGRIANKMGHGGGDFWVMYYFARNILFGEPAFFDVYRAADCTIPGILARQSSLQNGKPYDVPDFRSRKQRDRCRKDRKAQKRYDTRNGCFGANVSGTVAEKFSETICHLLRHATANRSLIDWLVLADDLKSSKDRAQLVRLTQDFEKDLPKMKRTFAQARRIIRDFPDTDGARILGEMLDVADAGKVTRKGFLSHVRQQRRKLQRK